MTTKEDFTALSRDVRDSGVSPAFVAAVVNRWVSARSTHQPSHRKG